MNEFTFDPGEDFAVLALDLAGDDELDGLLSWNFLQEFDYEIHSKKRLIRIARA